MGRGEQIGDERTGIGEIHAGEDALGFSQGIARRQRDAVGLSADQRKRYCRRGFIPLPPAIRRPVGQPDGKKASHNPIPHPRKSRKAPRGSVPA